MTSLLFLRRLGSLRATFEFQATPKRSNEEMDGSHGIFVMPTESVFLRGTRTGSRGLLSKQVTSVQRDCGIGIKIKGRFENLAAALEIFYVSVERACELFLARNTPNWLGDFLAKPQ